MRHVPIAEFKDQLSKVVAAVEAGEEVMITRHGRDIVKLVAADQDVIARRKTAMEGLFALRQRLRAKGIGATREEVREWIEEGRR